VSLAERIRREDPSPAAVDEGMVRQAIKEPIGEEPALHIDDFSGVSLIREQNFSEILQQRARLRAVGGDWIVQSRQVEAGYSDYCEYRLGLGRVHWVYPSHQPHDSNQVALECWKDRRVRHDLVQAIRGSGVRYIHPYLSNRHIWELASLLSSATRLPVRVIGPPPRLARWVNDKIEFSRLVTRLLGPHMVPHTEAAWNAATLARTVMRLAETHCRLGIKFPFASGGSGNFLVDCRDLRGQTLPDVRDFLARRLLGRRWPDSGRVLIDAWETDVVQSPSVQTWIPPAGCGSPLIEGLFQQIMIGEQQEFVGCQPASLPDSLQQKIVDDSYLLATVFQELGYVGRCSFDLILLSDSSAEDGGRVEFIECNGRWGGTSLPMTLVNRLGLWQSGRAWCVRQLPVEGLNQLEFSDIRRELGDTLFDRRAKFGKFILFNPARIQVQSCLDAIAIGSTQDEASRSIGSELPLILGSMVGRKTESVESRPGSGVLPDAADPKPTG
jgi:hypothetical protein